MGWIDDIREQIMQEEDVKFVQMIDEIVERKNMETDLFLSQAIKNELAYVYSLGSDKNTDVIITKERQVGASTFLLKYLEDCSEGGYKCLFICAKEAMVSVLKENYFHLFKKQPSVYIIGLKDVYNMPFFRNYDIVVFDEATLMNRQALNDCLKEFRKFKIFTVEKDGPRYDDIKFTGKEVRINAFNQISYDEPKKTDGYLDLGPRLINFSIDLKTIVDGYVGYCVENSEQAPPSDNAKNVDFLISLLKERLNNNLYVKHADGYGGVEFVKYQVFKYDQLKSFLIQSLSNFNQIPVFTNYDFSDCTFVRIFADILVQGALVQALGSQAVKERTSESAANNGAVGLLPPDISTMLFNQYTIESAAYNDKIKTIKQGGLDVNGKFVSISNF
jgi:hypothetical protein